jgi:hypothetical protein
VNETRKGRQRRTEDRETGDEGRRQVDKDRLIKEMNARLKAYQARY